MSEVQTVSIAVASASITLAAIYYMWQIRHQTKTRQTDLLVRVAPWVNISSSELQQALMTTLSTEYKDYDDFVKKYGQLHSNKPEQKAILAVINYLEGIGILVKRKLVDIDLVYEFWGPDINTIWEKLKPIIEGEKQKWHYPPTNAEYLYYELEKRKQKLQAKGA